VHNNEVLSLENQAGNLVRDGSIARVPEGQTCNVERGCTSHRRRACGLEKYVRHKGCQRR
jgi:ribosomal protein L15E